MSILGTLFGGGGPNVSALQKQQSNLIGRTNALAELLMQNYNQQAQAGAYDPNAQLELLRQDNDYSAKMASGNAAAAARSLGYRPGDSAPIKAQRAVSERASLDYAQLANQIRQQSADRQNAALSGAVSGAAGIYGQGIGAYGDQIRTGLAQQAQGQSVLGGLLGAAMPFLGGRTPTPMTTTAPINPYPRAGTFLRR